MISSEKLTALITEYLRDKAEFALVFGSITTEHFGPESDIDCAVLFPITPSWQQRIDMEIRLEDITGREVDLIVLNDADMIITMQVVANGTLLFERSSGAFNLFKAEKISEYIDFKASRAVIEKSMG